MVKKILHFFHKEIGGLHRAAYLLAFFSLLSQFLGFLRDRLLAGAFGVGETLDVYYASFRIPDFIFITVASLASLSILVPILVQKTAKSKEEAQVFIQNIFSFFLLVIGIVSIIAFFLMPYIVPLVFKGIAGGALVDLILFSRILLISPILLGISNIYASVTQAFGRFIIYATSPIVYNAGIVFGVVYLAPIWGIKGAIYGVLIGAVLHVAIQIPFLWKEGFLPRISFVRNIREILSVFAISIPRTLTLATSHISILILLSLASLLATGSITVFNFAFNLQSVLLSLIGVSYSLAVFPTLSRLYAESRMDVFVEHVVTSLKHIIFWSIPGTVLFIVLRAQIVRTVLGSGAFTWEATRLTAASLALFVASVALQNITLLFIRAYYAIGKTFTPLVINVFSAFFTILSSYVFLELFREVSVFRFFIENLLRVSDVPGTEILALALGFSFGSCLNTVLLWLVFRFDFGSFTHKVRRTLFEVMSSSIIMGFVTYQALNFFVYIFDVQTLVGIFLQGLSAGLVGIVVCIVILHLLRSEELKDMKESLSKRFFKTAVVGPDAEVI